MANLGCWLGRHKLTADDLSLQRLQAYLRYRRRHLRPHPSDSSALEKLLRLLREKGVVTQDPPFPAPDPIQRVEEDFGRYLLQERGLSLATVVYYRSFTRQFLLGRFGTDRIRFTRLGALTSLTLFYAMPTTSVPDAPN